MSVKTSADIPKWIQVEPVQKKNIPLSPQVNR